MMVVNKNNLRVILFNIFLLLSTLSSAESKVTENEIIKFSQNNVTESTRKLGNRIEYCEKLKQRTNNFLLNKSYLKKIGANNNDVIIALTQMSIKNNFECEKNAKVELSYHLGMLASIKRQYKLNIKEITGVEDNLIYPSIKEVSVSVKYSKLPNKLKQYIHTVVGDKPFNLIKVLMDNHLIKL